MVRCTFGDYGFGGGFAPVFQAEADKGIRIGGIPLVDVQTQGIPAGIVQSGAVGELVEINDGLAGIDVLQCF